MTKEEIIQEIRRFFSDFAENNRLLMKEEFSDQKIEDAISRAINDYNLIPPLTNKTFENLNDQEKKLIIKGACAELLYMGAAYFMRNTLQTRTDVAVLDYEDKPPNYVNLASQLKNEFFSLAQQLKIQINMLKGPAVILSPYYHR